MIWFYWGNTRMSFLRYMTLRSACAYNPQVILVRRSSNLSRNWDEQQDMQYYEGRDYTPWLAGLGNLSQVWLEDLFPELAEMRAPEIHTSDLFSWLVLAEYGGTVSDMDIAFVAPVPEVEQEVQLIRFEETGYTPVSFMQGRPSSFWWAMYKRALRSYDPAVYESCGSSVFEVVGSAYGQGSSFSRLAPDTVFPFHKLKWKAMNAALFRHRRSLPKNCVGVHWYAGANRKYNAKIDHKNFREFDCTVTEVIARCYDAR